MTQPLVIVALMPDIVALADPCDLRSGKRSTDIAKGVMFPRRDAYKCVDAFRGSQKQRGKSPPSLR